MTTLSRRSFLVFSGGALLTAACGSSGGSSAAKTTTDAAGNVVDNATLRLAYFPNLTHVQPNVGLENGMFAKTLGDAVNLQPKAFTAGPATIEALFAGDVDAAYVGPSPAVNGYVQSGGTDLRVIAGATSGGVLFVVRPAANLNTPADFANKKIATPSLGNTQDVAARIWLKNNGLNAKEQGGNVSIIPTANAQQIQLFQQGDIDASWAPEPWGTRLIQEAGGKLYLDERDLWPNRQFCVTNLVVKTSYLQQHPTVIANLLRAHVDVTQFIKDNPDDAKALVNRRIEKDSGAALSVKVIDAAWGNQDITFDPLAPTLLKGANDAYTLGFLDKKPDLTNIYDLTLLNQVLKEKNLPAVAGFA